MKFLYYESIKRELKTRPINECQCDERLKTKVEESTRLAYTGLLGELEHLQTKTTPNFVGSLLNFLLFLMILYFNLKLSTSYNCTDLCFPPILGAHLSPEVLHPLLQGEACAHQQCCGRLKPCCGRLDRTRGFWHPVASRLQHSHAAHPRTSGDSVLF